MPEKVIEFSDWFIEDAPKTLSEVFGQKKIVDYIKSCQKNNKWDKSTFLSGDFGSGKTVLAKIMAKSIACKNKTTDGEPCNVCPTCAAINNEVYNRDVVYINAESESAQSVRDIVENSIQTPAIRDAAKVFIVDEMQALSKEGVEAFLIATQSPQKGVFFIFTAMSKLQGSKAGALQSRCKEWKMKVPTNDEIYMYLASICKKKELTKDSSIPKEFFGDCLKFIAENCYSSFRKAIQMLEQSYKGKLFTIEEIKDTFSIVSYEETALALADLSHGKITDNVFKMTTSGEYQDKFPLLLKIISDAYVLKSFGKLFDEEQDKWKEKTPASIFSGQYFDDLCNIFSELGKTAYIKRGDWQLALSKLVWKIKQEQIPTGVVKRRPTKS